MAEFLVSLVPALGQALLHFLWQGALIGLLAALALNVLRHARPQARYAMACLALLACVLLPCATLLGQFAEAPLAPSLVGAPAHAPSIGSNGPASGVLLGFGPPSERLDAFLPWVVALWSMGACGMSMRMALGLVWIRRLRHTPQGAEQAVWQARLDALAKHFGLRRGVALRLVDRLDSPVSAGWWRPVVLLPASLLTRMPSDLIEALLAHELAHVRRHDYLINLLQNAVEALLFYHPVIWWLSYRIRVEREQIADQLAAEVACAPRHLAIALSELSEIQSTRPALHLAQAAHGGQLMSRIQQLVRPTCRTHPVARFVFPLLGVVAAGIAFYTYAQIGKPDQVARGQGTHVALAGGTQGGKRDTFALVRSGGRNITAWGPDDDMTAIKAAKLGVKGEFLWVRRAGRDYVITDPALLARAGDAWRETEALGKQMEALGGQMEGHGKKMEALGARMETLSVRRGPSPEVLAAMREVEGLARQQQALALQQLEVAKLQLGAAQEDSVQRQQLERRMEALSAKQEELARLQERKSEVMEAEAKRLEAQEQPMAALSREMELASEPMAALGKQMEALGRKQEKAAAQAERDLRALVTEALAKGLARPIAAPASAR